MRDRSGREIERTISRETEVGEIHREREREREREPQRKRGMVGERKRDRGERKIKRKT